MSIMRDVVKLGSTVVSHKMVVPDLIEPEDGDGLDNVMIAPPKPEQPTNCKNCGAVLNGRLCEYCGTEYGPEPMLIVKGQPADMEKLINQLHKTGIVPVKNETEVTS